MNPQGAAQANARVDEVVAELAALILDGHDMVCTHEASDLNVMCVDDKARAVLAYLHDAGMLVTLDEL